MSAVGRVAAPVIAPTIVPVIAAITPITFHVGNSWYTIQTIAPVITRTIVGVIG